MARSKHEESLMQNPKIWKKLGWELRFVELLIIKLLCDCEYQTIIDKKTMKRLSAAAHQICQYRMECENRMFRFRKFTNQESSYFFFGNTVLNEKTENFVKQVRQMLNESIDVEVQGK